MSILNFHLVDANRSGVAIEASSIAQVYAAAIDGTIIVTSGGRTYNVIESYEDVVEDWQAGLDG